MLSKAYDAHVPTNVQHNVCITNTIIIDYILITNCCALIIIYS